MIWSWLARKALLERVKACQRQRRRAGERFEFGANYPTVKVVCTGCHPGRCGARGRRVRVDGGGVTGHGGRRGRRRNDDRNRILRCRAGSRTRTKRVIRSAADLRTALLLSARPAASR